MNLRKDLADQAFLLFFILLPILCSLSTATPRCTRVRLGLTGLSLRVRFTVPRDWWVKSASSAISIGMG